MALVFKPAAEICFSDGWLREWVEAYPGRIDDLDTSGITPLFAAAFHRRDLALVQGIPLNVLIHT